VPASPSPDFKLAPLPRLREATILGSTLRYYDAGRGPPLVLVHGVGGDADQWCFCLAAFSARYRIIALDLPGFGRSDKPAIDYRIAHFVDALAALVKALELPPAHLLGHSLGGWIVASYALARPQDVRSLILNDAVGLDEGASALPVDLHLTTRANLRKAFEAMFFDQGKVSDALVDLAYGLHRSRGDGPTIDSVLRTLAEPGEKLDGRLASIRVPALLLWGEDDRIAPLAMAEAFRRGLPDARLATLPRCGHLPCIEQPEAFAENVLRFLEGLQGR
jgi:pimeloyl-ACP methyl ester carboxylesterase